jgi:uncharacterized protein (DUF2141 family)
MRGLCSRSTGLRQEEYDHGEDSKVPVPRIIPCFACFASLIFGILPAAGSAQSPCPGIHVQILNIRNSTGTIDCALFASPEGFPREALRSATVVVVLKIKATQARCDFESIPPGKYALAVIHDENMNGKLDSNWMGIPNEGYGFSNNTKVSSGPPSFSDAGFEYEGKNLDFTITLHY